MSSKLVRFVVAVVVALVAWMAPVRIAAAAPGFPDVNAFTPVDIVGYVSGVGSDAKVIFSTVDGVVCSYTFILKAAENPAFFTAPVCSGNISGIPESVPDNGGPGCARVWWAFPGQFQFDRHWGNCPPFPPVAVLSPGQKIETGDTTCVAGDGLLACIDPTKDHGFVLRPSGSSVF